VQQRGQNHHRRARISSSITISSAMARIVPSDCREEQMNTTLTGTIFLLSHAEKHLENAMEQNNEVSPSTSTSNNGSHIRVLAVKITDDA